MAEEYHRVRYTQHRTIRSSCWDPGPSLELWLDRLMDPIRSGDNFRLDLVLKVVVDGCRLWRVVRLEPLAFSRLLREAVGVVEKEHDRLRERRDLEVVGLALLQCHVHGHRGRCHDRYLYPDFACYPRSFFASEVFLASFSCSSCVLSGLRGTNACCCPVRVQNLWRCPHTAIRLDCSRIHHRCCYRTASISHKTPLVGHGPNRERWRPCSLWEAPSFPVDCW